MRAIESIGLLPSRSHELARNLMVSPQTGLAGGRGDMWWIEADASYPDGSVWSTVILIELRDGKVLRERWHFGQPFEAPSWRAPFVERMDGEAHDRS